MSYADAKPMATTAIPVIDMASLHEGTVGGARHVARQLLEAAETVGFFYVRNHGIPQDLIARTEAVARRFFALPLEEKQKVKVAPWHRGYIKVGEAKMYESAKIDLKESFIWGMEVSPGEAATEAGIRLRALSRKADPARVVFRRLGGQSIRPRAVRDRDALPVRARRSGR